MYIVCLYTIFASWESYELHMAMVMSLDQAELPTEQAGLVIDNDH